MEFAEIMLKYGNQKIAVCISGQPRTWKNCIGSWFNVFLGNEIYKNVDVFCHVWDYNTVPNCISGKSEIEKVSPEEIQSLTKNLRPKKVLIESFKEFVPFKSAQPINYSPFLSQFYGIMRAARLKKEYEIENNIMYDVVVRLRYDAFFFNRVYNDFPQVTENTMHGFHFTWDPLINQGRIGDIFWFADSQTYDIIADYYLNIHTIDPGIKDKIRDFAPEHIFFHYIKKNNINIQPNYWDIKLFRKSAEEAFSKDKTSYETW